MIIIIEVDEVQVIMETLRTLTTQRLGKIPTLRTTSSWNKNISIYKGVCTRIFITAYFEIVKPEITWRSIKKGMVSWIVNSCIWNKLYYEKNKNKNKNYMY